MLRSAPEPEFETVDSSDHLYKFCHEVPWSDSIQSSTSDLECWESVPGTWHKCPVKTEKINSSKCVASTLSCKVPLLRPNGPVSNQPCGRLKPSTPELRAQLNLTRDHQKKEGPHLKSCACLNHRACCNDVCCL